MILNPETSLVDFLKSNDIDSSDYNRGRIAKLLGVTNYSGAAYQNEYILIKLKAPAVGLINSLLNKKRV